MKRVLVLVVGVALIGGGVVAGMPTLATAALRAEGVVVAAARWSAEGLRFEGVTRGEARAERILAGWDRVVRVEGLTVPVGAVKALASGGESAGDREAGGAGVAGAEGVDPEAASGAVPAWARALVRSVEVRDARVPDTPLPALSGQVWPERRLVGEGLAVEGDAVRAKLPTALGDVEVEAARGAAGIDLVVRCGVCTVPAPSEADAGLALPPVVVRGVWADGAFTGTARVEDVAARVVARPDREGIVADVSLTEAPIASVYGLLGAWVPEARRARIEGTLSVVARVRWADGDFTVETLDPSVAGFSVDGLVPDALAGGRFQFRGRNPNGDDTLFTRGEGSPEWVDLSEMGAWLPAAVIAAEDAGFRAHPGYDLAGMREAAAKNAEEGDIVRGGSTLTQQLAKNLFLDGTRSYARKLRELLYAVEMERELGKPRILALYLNVVEFGPGIRGAKAAAETYFLKSPAGLLPEEAAWLASILRYPKTAYKRQYLQGSVDASRVRWILENLRGVPEEPRMAALGRTVRLVPP